MFHTAYMCLNTYYHIVQNKMFKHYLGNGFGFYMFYKMTNVQNRITFSEYSKYTFVL